MYALEIIKNINKLKCKLLIHNIVENIVIILCKKLNSKVLQYWKHAI